MIRGVDINNEEEVRRKISQVINESRMEKKEVKEENRVIDGGFGEIGRLQK